MPTETPRSAPACPAGARLRPGVHVVRRDADHLQVGLDRRRAVVLADVEPVGALLDALASGTGPSDVVASDPVVAAALRRLLGADLLVDAAAVAGSRARHGRDRTSAAYLRWGSTATDRLDRRRRSRVDLLAPTHRPSLDLLRQDLDRLGLTLAEHPEHPEHPGHAGDAEDLIGLTVPEGGVRVVLALSDGPLLRARLDPLVRAGVPHLVVSGEGPGLRVGPFVVPGLTACLRCLDAHEATEDPRWGLVREQVARRRHPSAPDPLDERLALAWAGADLVRFVDGDPPSTWSATVTLGPAAPEPEHWRRHPHCGCAWDVLAPAG